MSISQSFQAEIPKTKNARINQALKKISSPGSRRALKYIADKPGALTHEISRNCCIGNVSHAFRSIRKTLQFYGLQVVCELPKPVLMNEMGQRLQFHQWRIVAVQRETKASAV